MNPRAWLLKWRSALVARTQRVAERPPWLAGALTLGAAALASLGVLAAIGLDGSKSTSETVGRDAVPRAVADPAGDDQRKLVPLPRSLAGGATTGAATTGGTIFSDTGMISSVPPAGTDGAAALGTTAAAVAGTTGARTGSTAREPRGARTASAAAGTTATTLAGPRDVTTTTETPTTTAPTPGTPTEPPEPPPPPVPPGPLEISDVTVQQTTPFSATVSWRSSLPGRGQVQFGTDAPAVWSESDDGTEHKITVGVLTQSTEYVFRVVSWDRFERQVASGVGGFTTPRLTSSPTATVRGDTIFLNGQPYFPKMVWERCDVPRELLPFGIDLFMGCPADRSVAWRLGHDAYTLAPAGHTVTGGAVIGRYLPDEWDNELPGNTTVADLNRWIPPKHEDEIDFLGLTNHFYSFAAPLPHGRGMYPALMQKADVLGFNLYPLQIWCRANAFQHVFLSQRELHTQSGGKPTFQWIEANPMEHPCGHEPHLAVTNETVRAEVWLAIAGGADGIGYFPHGWNASVAAEIKRTNNAIKALAPALLSPETGISTTDGSIHAGARAAHGALYVVAVNSTRNAISGAEIAVQNLNGRPLTVFGENRTVNSSGDTFRDDFGPLEVHVYVAAPTA